MDRPTEGIVVDASTRGNPGPSEYRGVDLATGEILFEKKIGVASNNIAEYIALVHGIGHAIKHGYENVYTDSMTAFTWMHKKEVNSKLPASEKTKRAHSLKNRCMDFMRDKMIAFDGIDAVINEKISVEKWYSSEWGEIPADYGRK